MDLTITIITSIACALIYVFIIKPKRDKKAAAAAAAAKKVEKEEGRYYFYNDRCSFKLAKEAIYNDTVEKDGLKHTLMTDSRGVIILEIRPGMPQFPSSVLTKTLTVAGFPCLAAQVNPLIASLREGGYDQYFINCGEFVVQVSMAIASEEFLNSFRLD